jgi:hypothetical protein
MHSLKASFLISHILLTHLILRSEDETKSLNIELEADHLYLQIMTDCSNQLLAEILECFP